MTRSIAIIGGGLAGLTLGRCLLHAGMQCTIYEKAPNKPRHNYGITLHHNTYQELLKSLHNGKVLVDHVSDFRNRLAVDEDAGGVGSLGIESTSFRANRYKLEKFLAEGLNVQYNKSLRDLMPDQDRESIDQLFTSTQADVVIAADGIHSGIRKALLPHVEPRVLPLVAYNGKRKLSSEVWQEFYKAAMRDTTVLEKKVGDTLLNISLNEIETEGGASISWTYSRAPRGEKDVLHRPERVNADAQKIPEALFSEIRTLGDLDQPFREVFDAEKMRQDRVLHWLMRATLVPLQDLQGLATASKGVIILGDAAHAEPIVGGNGANNAILDAVLLARKIIDSFSEGKEVNGRLEDWYREMFPRWDEAHNTNETRMRKMHEMDQDQAHL